LANLDMARMLMVSGGLTHLKRHQGLRDYHFENELSLLDLVILLLVDACTAVVQDGVLQDYVVEENDLSVMRGRLRIDEQMKRRYGQVNRLECRYDDHQTDVVDNQILYSALALSRRYVQHPLVRGRVQALAETFAGICSPLREDWHEVRSGMIYHRLNARYQNAHNLAWIVMEGLGVHNLLAAGHTQGFAFLLNMNALFETFITVLMRAVLKEHDLVIHAQAKSGGHIWDVGRDRSYRHIIPDLLVEKLSGDQLAIDAKYKRYDEQKLAEADIYQVFLYAHAFRDSNGKIPSALLLYPSEGRSKQPTQLHIRDGQGYTQARLYALGVDIPSALNGLMGRPDEGVFEHIHSIVQSLLI
jgi:5-methylcytosine-specific restriction enzyme subunit McrC